MPFWPFCHFQQLFLRSSRFCLKRRFWAGFAEIEPVWQITQFPTAFPRLKQFPKITVLRSFYQKKAILAKTTVLSSLTILPFCAALSKRKPFCLKKVLRMTWNEHFVQFSWKAHCFPVLATISGQWRFWELWRSKMRFGQNVLCMAWKERFVKLSWKAHCFPVLKRISGEFHDFENFDGQKCDLAKTCCAWPEKRVLYNFHEKRTFFPFWREFEASVTILTTLTLTNSIWPKRAAHDLKRAFCTIFMESALFSRLEENLGQV